MAASGCSFALPDYPTAVVAVVEWCMQHGHYIVRVTLESSSAFSVQADGPGLPCARLEALSHDRVLAAIGSMSAMQLTVRSAMDLDTRSIAAGVTSRCTQPRRCPGIDVTVHSLFCKAHVRAALGCARPPLLSALFCSCRHVCGSVVKLALP